MKNRILASLVAVTPCVFLPAIFAQEDEEEIFQLSPFQVDASDDRGYRATNTLNGSRLNTALRDTPAAISVLTKEFLEDIGATDLDSMLQYDINAEDHFVDTDFGGNSAEDHLPANGATFRSRSLTGSVATDGFRAAGSGDVYNIERVGTSRGPNAILFGVGSPGGVVNFRTKKANTNRNSNELEFKIGSDSLRRGSFDFNRVIVDKKLGLRVMGLWEEKGSHRPFVSSDKKSITIAANYKMSEKTNLSLSFEDTESSNVTSRRWGPVDNVSQFQSLVDSGQVAFDPDSGNYKSVNADGSLGANVGSGQGVGNLNRRALIVTNSDDNNILFLEGNGFDGGANSSRIRNYTSRVTNRSLVNNNNAPVDSPSLFPIGVTTSTGVSETGSVDSTKLSAILTHQLMDGMFIELAYNDSERRGGGMIGRNPVIRADLTYTLPDGSENPFHFSKGYYFIEQDFVRLFKDNNDETKRFSWSYEKELGERLGFHRFAILAEEHVSHVERDRRRLVWEGRAIDPRANPDAANNRVFIRNYFKISDDYSDIRAGSLENMGQGGHIFNSSNLDDPLVVGFARNNSGDQDDVVTTNTKMFVMQNYFFNRRFVTTLGVRDDDLESIEPTMIRDPDTREWRFTTSDDVEAGLVEEQFEFFETSGDRTSLGAVFHLNDIFSLTANQSEGVQLADRNRVVLPYFLVPEPIKGEGEDYGISFSLFGNRLSGSLKYFKSEAIGQASNWDGAAFIGPNRDIIENFENVFNNAGITDLGAASITPLEFVNVGETFSITSIDDLDALHRGGPYKFKSDRASDGYELEILGQINDNWDIRLNASKTTTSRDNVLLEGEAWWAERLNLYSELDAYWTSLGNESVMSSGLVDEDGVVDPDRTPNDRIAESDENLARDRLEQSSGFGSRPEKFNLWTRYRFTDGRFEGLSLGGGWRYQAGNIAGIDLVNETTLIGERSAFVDFMASYRTKGFFGRGDKLRVTYQLNVNNLLDADTFLSTKIWTNNTTNEPYAKRGYKVDPRKVTFTVRTQF